MPISFRSAAVLDCGAGNRACSRLSRRPPREPYRAASIALAGLLLTSCGNVGDPMYPSLNIPVRVVDLRAVEHGPAISIDFTIPDISTDNVAIKTVRGVELYCGTNQVPVYRTTPGAVHATCPVNGLAGKEVPVRVRVVGSKGHASDWSNTVTLHVVPPLAPPSDVTAEAVAEGVKVTWLAPGEPNFRIFRLAPQETRPTQIGESGKPEYIDTKTEYDKTYQYSVQGVNGQAESEVSGVVSVTPRDVFPPAVPTGLTASPGVNTVELAWNRDTEPDLRGYRVYRSTDNGPFERIAGTVEAPSYSDKTITSGKHYRYAISAVDQSGNESKQSAPVEITP